MKRPKGMRKTKIAFSSSGFLALVIIALFFSASLYNQIFNNSNNPTSSITIWHDLTMDETLLRETIDASFRMEHPSIEVELQYVGDKKSKLLEAIPNNLGPDVFIGPHDWLGELAQRGYVVPIDNFVTTELREEFVESALEATTYNGRIYGLPLAADTVALIYNKALVNDPPRSTDELVTIMEKHKNMGRYGISYQIDPYFVSAWVHAFGGWYFDDTNKRVGVNSIGTIRAIEFLLETFKPYMSKNLETQLAVFLDGDVPFMINGPWSIQDVKRAGIDFGVTLLPRVSHPWVAETKPYSGIIAVWMTRNVKDKESAFSVMRWLATNPEHVGMRVKKFGYVPVLKKVLEWESIKNDPIITAFAEQVKQSIPMPKSPEMKYVWEPVYFALLNLWRGMKTPREALSEAQTWIERNMGR